MRFCTFSVRGSSPGIGEVMGDSVFPAKGRASVLEAIGGRDRLRKGDVEGLSLSSVDLLAPVQRPGKIVAAIVNTAGMLGGKDVTLSRPRIDMKAPSAVVGPGAEVRAPAGGIRPEVELAAVIGSRVSRATAKEASAGIAGYTILNDVTAPQDSRDDAYEAYRRDRKTGVVGRTTMRGPLFRSKNHDTFCPMGPWLVTADELGDPADLEMTTKFNGEVVQRGSTSEYIFSPAEIASYVSGFLTLEPGDVVSCGSVGWTEEALGALDPTEYVLPKGGGTLELEIEGIGILRNPVTEEQT